MAKNGLRKWVAEKWVDIGAPDGKGGYKPCGRKMVTREKVILNVDHQKRLVKKPPKLQVLIVRNKRRK